jgi:hypothetical protein
MGRMCVAGHQDFGCKELEECGIKWGRMAGNSEEGQGPKRAVAPMMMMMKRELYRPNDHCLSAKLVPTFADRRCRVVSATDSHGR